MKRVLETGTFVALLVLGVPPADAAAQIGLH